MGKFIVFTFLVLGVVFYEMSGGSEFEPELRAPIAVAETKLDPSRTAPVEPQVARADTSTLIQISAPATSAPVEPVVEQVAFVAPLPAGEVVITPAPVSASVEPVVEAPVEQTPIYDIRTVAGDWVNMRSGPSTDYRVLDTLPRGTEAEVVEVNADGWARIVVMTTGQEGWMAERLLSNL